MIEADVKKFLNSRTPNDVSFKPLDQKIDDVLSGLTAAHERERKDKYRRMFKNAYDYCKGITLTTNAAEYFPTVRDAAQQSNVFLSSHYANSVSWAHINSFKLRISDDVKTYIYLYTDGSSDKYNYWRLGGAYNRNFLGAATRTALTFTGLPEVSLTAMDASADCSIVAATSNSATARLTVLKRNDGSNTAYSTVTVDTQPAANATAIKVSGDGSRIFLIHTAAPWVSVYRANADKTVYTLQNNANIGITTNLAVYNVTCGYDGSTFALMFNSNSAVAPAVEVYRILSGEAYTKVGVDYVAINGATTPFNTHSLGLQISRDGNTLLFYLLTSTGYYAPILLKFREDAQSFAIDTFEQSNQLWQLGKANYVYGIWASSSDMIWQMSADGNWLFCSRLIRSTSSPYYAYNALSVMNISDGKIKRAETVHSALFTTSNPGATNAGQYCLQSYFWVDPQLRYIFRGVIPNGAYTNNSSVPYYSYYLNSTNYRSNDIIILDLSWLD